MSDLKKVSDNLSVTGQISSEQLTELAAEGFKSVLNLRSSDEKDFLNDEQEQANAAGLAYVNIPLDPQEPNQHLTAAAIAEIKHLSKPILIHCANGVRAGGIALIADAIQAALTYGEILHKAQKIGINLEQPHLKQFLLEKIATKQLVF
jgi:uncharacterized protein (TIGR01244 family)